MRRVCVCGECIDPLPPQQKFSICLNQDTVVQACYLAVWLLDEAPGEHTVGKTRDGVGQGLPIFIISLRKLSLLNYLHALFDKNWNFKIEKRRWERRRGPRRWHGTFKGWDRETEANRKQEKGHHRDRWRKGHMLCGRLRREVFKKVS